MWSTAKQLHGPLSLLHFKHAYCIRCMQYSENHSSICTITDNLSSKFSRSTTTFSFQTGYRNTDRWTNPQTNRGMTKCNMSCSPCGEAALQRVPHSITKHHLCIAAATSQKPCGGVLLRSQCTTDNFRFSCSNFDRALAPESPAWFPLSAHHIRRTWCRHIHPTKSQTAI